MRPWSVTASLAFILMTLLLMMFLYAVVATPPEEATRSSEEPALEPPTPPPPAPAPALAARRPQAPTSLAGAARRPGAGYAARHAPAAVPAISPPKVTSRPRRGSALALILVIAGLAMAVIGGWLLLSKGHAAPCLHSIPASCMICHTVEAAIGWPSLMSSPCTRRCPHAGFSVAMRMTSLRIAASVDGRPGRRRFV